MTIESTRLALAEQIAERWNSEGIRYAVVHGLKDYPDRLGRDIDLVMHKTDVCEAMRIAIEVGKKVGFSTHLVRWSAWGLYQLALIDKTTGNSLPLDFMCTTGLWQAKFTNFMSNTRFERVCNGDGDIGPFRVSNEGLFIKACLRPLVCGDIRRFGDLNKLSGKEEFSLPVILPNVLSGNDVIQMIGSRGMQLLELPNKKCLESAYPAAIFRFQARWIVRKPVDSIICLVNGMRRHIELWVQHSSPIILIKTNNPKVLIDSFDQHFELYKRQFFEVRLYNYDPKIIAKSAGFLYRWRYKPISEFNLSVVIQGVDNDVDSSSVSTRAGRWKLGPEYEISLKKTDSIKQQMKFINSSMLDLLVERHSYTDCCMKP